MVHMADGIKIESACRIDSFLCSIITPIYNGAHFLKECLDSILQQKNVDLKRVEFVLLDDSSTDKSCEIVESLLDILCRAFGRVLFYRAEDGPSGVGSARNKACRNACSPVLVFQDADDVMRPMRIARTLEAFQSVENRYDVIGGVFDRIPFGSTPRYERYHQRLRTDDLFAHAFRDAPLAFPTVSCRTEVWETTNFREGRGVAEDMHFLYDAMKNGFKLGKLNGDSLTGYRYHDEMTSHTLHRRTLLSIRVEAFESLVLSLPAWQDGFAIWGCGRDGRDVFRRLSQRSQNLVTMWADVDVKKIGKVVYDKPVVHFSQVRPPIACCVALDRSGGGFEANLDSLHLEKGVEYVHLV
ncbi:Glycosyltransferase 2 [Gracilaria domingensis]|nr:Glycosyltransferase 2 [Gracilaria domingensis]